jgi:hypothetical protein
MAGFTVTDYIALNVMTSKWRTGKQFEGSVSTPELAFSDRRKHPKFIIRVAKQGGPSE